jgi:hypothetical protein
MPVRCHSAIGIALRLTGGDLWWTVLFLISEECRDPKRLTRKSVGMTTSASLATHEVDIASFDHLSPPSPHRKIISSGRGKLSLAELSFAPSLRFFDPAPFFWPAQIVRQHSSVQPSDSPAAGSTWLDSLRVKGRSGNASVA